MYVIVETPKGAPNYWTLQGRYPDLAGARRIAATLADERTTADYRVYRDHGPDGLVRVHDTEGADNGN